MGRYDANLLPLPVVPKNIYVAASVNNQLEALRTALQLQKLGYNITSRWLNFQFENRPQDERLDVKEARSILWGQNDLDDLAAADTLLLLATTASSSGGYHVELGFFLGRGSGNILVVGDPKDRPNVFFYSHKVRFATTVGSAIAFLGSGVHGPSKLAAGDSE